MTDLFPQFETSDLVGSTTHFSGTATSSAVQLPSPPTSAISEVMIKNKEVSGSETLQVSFDGGVNYFDIDASDILVWAPKGEITSLYLRASEGSVDYQVVMNREPE